MHLPVALYRTSSDGELLAANHALASLLGFGSVAEAMEEMKTVESVYVDPARRALWLDEIAVNGVARDFDVELRRRDGTRVWVQDTARAVFGEDGRLLFCEGALIDVTEKVRAKKARDEFVATVSHELRNPVSVLFGLAQEMADDYESFNEQERREIASLMARQADDASWIIEDLLVAYREDMDQIPLRVETFDLAEEVNRVLEGFEADVAIEPAQGDSRVLADPHRIRQVLHNLVSNAVRYGGEVIKVSVRASGEMVEVAVSDSGGPIAPEEVERIFEPFQRGSGLLDSKSVGLGLAVARKLAIAMGGGLVYKHDGSFSSFIVTLPAAL